MATNSSDVVAGTNATATQYNNLRKDNLIGANISHAETDGTTVTIDFSDQTKGKIRRVTLGGNRTLAFSNVLVDQVFVLELIQDGTGTRTVTWPANITWVGSVAPTLTTTINKKDTFAFICTTASSPGPAAYEGYIVGQNVG